MNLLQFFTSIYYFPLYVDNMAAFDIYNGTGQLSPWKSFAMIGAWLFALGFSIKGVSILVRSMRDGSPGQVMNGLMNLLGSIVVFGILWAISGASF